MGQKILKKSMSFWIPTMSYGTEGTQEKHVVLDSYEELETEILNLGLISWLILLLSIWDLPFIEKFTILKKVKVCPRQTDCSPKWESQSIENLGYGTESTQENHVVLDSYKELIAHLNGNCNQLKIKAMGQKILKSMSFWIPTKKNKIHVKQTIVKQNITPATFQTSLKATLIIGQIFSLMPVVGVYSDNPANVRFVSTSWKCMYSLLSFVGQVFITTMCIYKLTCSVTSLKATTPIIFYGTTSITMVMFFHMARAWPCLVQHVAKTEELDPLFDKGLKKRCNITCVVVLSSALLEHILSLLSAFSETMVCHSDKAFYEGFVKHFYPWLFNFIPYSPYLGAFTQFLFFLLTFIWNYSDLLFLHFQSTFIWNYSDLFVICMSYYLTSRLQHINEKLLEAQGKYLPEAFWKSTREDYCRATQLVRRVDEVISGIIFISFANNLFFICLQLFNTLEDGIKGTGECNSRSQRTPSLLGGYEAAAYFLFSLVYLIIRSIAVSLIVSQVNSASTVPAPVLYDVPSPVYCIEVQRFLDQVNGDNVALSGLQFFSVTRGLLLTVAGTIVTYELVMFQFT